MDCEAAMSRAYMYMSSSSWRLYEIFKPRYLNMHEKVRWPVETSILVVSGRA